MTGPIFPRSVLPPALDRIYSAYPMKDDTFWGFIVCLVSWRRDWGWEKDTRRCGFALCFVGREREQRGLRGEEWGSLWIHGFAIDWGRRGEREGLVGRDGGVSDELLQLTNRNSDWPTCRFERTGGRGGRERM